MAGNDPVLFLAMVALVSVSGVVTPGPLFATAIAKGYQDERAGIKVASGHALVELPLIVAIFLGLDTILKNDSVFIVIGLVGGVILLYLGIDTIKNWNAQVTKAAEKKAGSIVSGALMTAANPYFILWWATVGATLIAGTVEFGLIMLPIFAAVHLSCDYIWYTFVSFTVFRSKGAWSQKRHKYIFAGAGGIMVFFGLYFLTSSVSGLLQIH